MALNPILKKRLTIEANEMRDKPPENCSAGPNGSDLTKWSATIIGPKNTPYSDGVFYLTISFSNNYPYKAPTVSFDTPIYHPNISKNGAICIDILKDQWSAVLTTQKVLLSISSLLADPNPNDPLEPEIARQFRDNKLKFDITARQWTDKHATGERKKADAKKPAESDESDDSESE
jgi:ubiquitin-conjugating enzyme E2 D/E